MFKTLPKHGSVLDLFPQRTQHGLQPQQQQQQTTSAFDMAVSPGYTMDESFGIDNSREGAKYNDFSFDEESVNSPASPAYFQTHESSPYGMDICSPSPGIPMCKKRITQQSVVEESGGKVFGYKKEVEPPIPSFNNPPGTLLKKLTADVGDTSSSTMSVGSLRSNRSSGKVGSIKSISTLKDRDPLSKARARARTGLPSSWIDQRPRSMIQLPDSQTIDVLSQGFADASNRSGDDVGDVSMEDAMDIDSPLAARRPPTAQLKPRPLSLFIPSATHSPALSQQNSASSAVPPSSSIPSAISGGPDEFGRFFVDTPEPVEKTAIPRYNEHGQEVAPFLFAGRGSFPSLQIQDSSPVASPSAERVMRCTSATLPPPSSSFGNLFLNANRGSSTGSLNSATQPKSAGLVPTSRIPSLRTKVMQRPGISALKAGQPAQETQSAVVVPSARMAPMNQRRALSAFIQPEQFSIQGPASRTAIPRPTSGLAKGRVVSMLVPSTSNGDDDVDDSGNEFSSPSMARGIAAGHRRMRSNGGLGVIGRGGSLAMRTASQQQAKASSLFASNDPSPVKPLLPFGDGEHSGKILPCHSVKEDGLMRITPATLRALLSGAYDAQISAYKVIDCRFAFEYEGGHIGGAINLNKDEDIEKFLLDDVIRRGELPVPCNSGMPGLRPPILVFHCEFSAKRGPTFAKHFRAKDRSRNAHVYPKLHYPELYILEGGYCSYFSAYPETCDPCGYVQMDAPQHSLARAADLGQFRKWNRTRSYTYGDAQAPTQSALSIQPSQSAESTQYKRSTVPRSGAQYGTHERVQSYSGLHTLQEDHGSPEKDYDVEDTPDLDQDQEYDTETPCVLTEAESNDDAVYYDAPETQDTSFDFEEEDGALDLAEFGVSEATIDAEGHHEEVAEEQEGENEEDDDLDHADSSPCVTAEMKRNKKFGRSLLERTFKPLSFGKPSFIPQSRARGMARAVSHVV